MISKEVVPFNTSITDLISKAPESPPFFQLRNSINYLKSIDALDTWEDMTELGVHLINMPIDFKLAKMIFYSIVLKCLNPALVIAASLSVQEHSLLCVNSTEMSHKQMTEFLNLRKKLTEGLYSDHVALYKLYLIWKKFSSENGEADFCAQYFVSSATMHRIDSLRVKLLSYLRTSGLVKSLGEGDLASLNANSDNLNCLRAILVASFYPNIVRVDKKNRRLLNE